MSSRRVVSFYADDTRGNRQEVPGSTTIPDGNQVPEIFPIQPHHDSTSMPAHTTPSLVAPQANDNNTLLNRLRHLELKVEMLNQDAEQERALRKKDAEKRKRDLEQAEASRKEDAEKRKRDLEQAEASRKKDAEKRKRDLEQAEASRKKDAEKKKRELEQAEALRMQQVGKAEAQRKTDMEKAEAQRKKDRVDAEKKAEEQSPRARWH
ncbi:hypothetical protein JOM56_015260 [Amanita muscaria]